MIFHDVCYSSLNKAMFSLAIKVTNYLSFPKIKQKGHNICISTIPYSQSHVTHSIITFRSYHIISITFQTKVIILYNTCRTKITHSVKT